MTLPPAFTSRQFVAEEPSSALFGRGKASVGGEDQPSEDLPLDCTLSCIAAFYPSESAMRDAARSLLRHHGLTRSQLVLMGPRDADPARFARHAQRWTGRWT